MPRTPSAGSIRPIRATGRFFPVVGRRSTTLLRSVAPPFGAACGGRWRPVSTGPYSPTAELGYPALHAEAAALHTAGVDFHSLTGVFKSTHVAVYEDTCYHVNQLGNEMIADALLAALGGAHGRPGAGLSATTGISPTEISPTGISLPVARSRRRRLPLCYFPCATLPGLFARERCSVRARPCM